MILLFLQLICRTRQYSCRSEVGSHTSGESTFSLGGGSYRKLRRGKEGLLDLERAGKTVSNYTEGLSAFCDWCVRCDYLEKDTLYEV